MTTWVIRTRMAFPLDHVDQGYSTSWIFPKAQLLNLQPTDLHVHILNINSTNRNQRSSAGVVFLQGILTGFMS